MSVTEPDRFHAFNRLVLTLVERTFEKIRTEYTFELRATKNGAEVWRSSVLHAPGGTCESEERFVGKLTSRQIVDLLDEIERSGIYEALPLQGIVQGSVDNSDIKEPLVSMSVHSQTHEHTLFEQQPASYEIVHDISEAVRKRVDIAMERALTYSG